MANRLRLRQGQVQLVRVRVLADDTIEQGDLVWLDGKYARSAATFPQFNKLDGAHAVFADVFLGIAHQASSPGEAHDISVDISPLSVYEMDCVNTAYEVGDQLSLDATATNQFVPQRVRMTAPGIPGIARAVEYQTGGATLRVCLFSAFGAIMSRRAGLEHNAT